MTQTHTFPPVWDARSEILILGSFPSVKSREEGFYYGNPQNRFWRVLAAVYGERVPVSREERTALLLRRRAALWDVVSRCEIDGSDDASIRGALPNDLSPILAGAPIQHIFANGQAAARLYRRLLEPVTRRPALALPSTSPANAAWSLARLTEAWRAILPEGERP